MFKQIVLTVIAFVGITFSAFAQKQITGTVLDTDGNPMPGVSVVVYGTSTGTITDENGQYSLSAKPENSIEFLFFGMKSQKVSVGSNSKIDIVLEEDTTLLEEVVVTALGISKSEKSLGYAATTMKSEELMRQLSPVRAAGSSGEWLSSLCRG